jgi:tagatose 1,6-diphosphate aldolase
VTIACRAGASGFLGGRAIWQEALEISERAGRLNFFREVAGSRLKELSAITADSARPWFAKMGVREADMAGTGPAWYRKY